jgi:lsr operon transcriptional repressor
MKVNGEARDEERFQVKVAWMYHVEGLTQGVIAEHLGVTRLRVNRALGQARRNGIVRVHISSDYGPCMELEAEFRQRYGLDEVLIVPQPADDSQSQAIVGAELGRYLSLLLAKPEIKLFGISWGSAIDHATRSVIPCERRDLEIVSIMGGVPKGSSVSSFSITTRLAEQFQSDRTYFTAPLYASTEQSRDTILIQDVFQEVLGKLRKADAMAMAVGDASERSLLTREGLPKDITKESLLAAGAVGDLLGYFINKDGELIDHPINRRVIGLNPLQLREMPNVILASGGQYKVPIISAVLKMRIFNILITDEGTARSVLERDAR